MVISLSVETVLGSIALAFLKLFIGLILAIGSIYLGTNLLDRLTRDVDEWKEIKRGNFAIGILFGGVILSIAIIIESGVSAALSAIVPGMSFPSLIVSLFVSVLKLLVGVLAAVFSVYIALRVIDSMTKDIDELSELKKGNVAMAIVMASVMIAVSFVIKSSVDIVMAATDFSIISDFFGV